ncbi:MAG: TIGR01777 family oxidoreductase [Bacteroidales bacterium]|jgi:hypothetical protein
MTPTKTIGITGASGFIGTSLTLYLEKQGYTIKHLNRGFTLADVDICDIIINLAGASINRRWSSSAKKLIRESRIETTKRLVGFLNGSGSKRTILLISASAIGIYPTCKSKTDVDHKAYDEYSQERGDDFLTHTCIDWENEALKANSNLRVVIARFGVVLSNKGGALPKMSLPFKFGVAGTIGNGKQLFSWIALEDLLRALAFLIEKEELNGVFNFTSPNPVNNSELTQTLARKYKCPIKLRIPSFAFKVVYGEASTLFTDGQRVLPKRLIENGFTFNFMTIDSCIKLAN